MFLSFIIPAYNAEEYIERTVISIVSEIENVDVPIEIIIINDGSIDRTEFLIQELKKTYQNILFNCFFHNNSGLSATRNKGVLEAKGKYIWFFDSDDLIEKRILKDIIDKLSDENLDLLSLGVRDIFFEREIISNMQNKPISIVNGLDYISNYEIEHSSCAVIIKRKILLENNIFFIEGVLSEDYDYLWRLYEKCHRISHLNKVAYNYILRENSLSRKKDMKYYKFHHESMIKIFNYIQSYFSDLKDKKYLKAIQPHISKLKLIALIVLLKSPLSKTEKIYFYNKFKQSNIFDITYPIYKITLKQKIVFYLVHSRLYFFFLFLK